MHCIIVSLYHRCIVSLLHRIIVALLHCCIVALSHRCIVASLHCCIVASSHCRIVASSHHHIITSLRLHVFTSCCRLIKWSCHVPWRRKVSHRRELWRRLSSHLIVVFRMVNHTLLCRSLFTKGGRFPSKKASSGNNSTKSQTTPCDVLALVVQQCLGPNSSLQQNVLKEVFQASNSLV